MIDLVLVLFAGIVLALSTFSSLLQRLSLPGPLLALGLGVLIGPHVLGLLRIEDFGLPTGTLLEQASRITLAVGLTGVAMRLPHGYWRDNIRWLVLIIGVGMVVMLAVATGVLWALTGLPFLVALLLAAIITPTDPVVTTPVVTGSLAEERIPERVRHNLSSESGINDGLGYLFVMLPVLLITDPGITAQEFVTRVLLREVFGAAVFGVACGYLLGRLFVFVRERDLMEESSFLGFLVPLGLTVLGAAKLLGTDGLLAVFVAAAVFGQVIPQRDEAEEDKVDDAVNRFLLLPVFVLLGLALPFEDWARIGPVAFVVVLAAVVVRRLVALWGLYPLLRGVHDRPETFFLSWFGPIGISALFYATLAERHTGNPDLFVWATLAITASVLFHGLSTVPLSGWLRRREPERKQRQETPA